MSDADRDYIAMLRRKRAFFRKTGNVAKANEMDFLLGQAGFTADDEPEPARQETSKARAVSAEAPKGRAAPSRDKT